MPIWDPVMCSTKFIIASWDLVYELVNETLKKNPLPLGFYEVILWGNKVTILPLDGISGLWLVHNCGLIALLAFVLEIVSI